MYGAQPESAHIGGARRGVAMAAYRFNLEPALGVGMVMDDAARDRLVQGWNGTTSTLDDVRALPRWILRTSQPLPVLPPRSDACQVPLPGLRACPLAGS